MAGGCEKEPRVAGQGECDKGEVKIKGEEVLSVKKRSFKIKLVFIK